MRTVPCLFLIPMGQGRKPLLPLLVFSSLWEFQRALPNFPTEKTPMIFSATIPQSESADSQGENTNYRYFKRRLKMKDIQKQKYFVPMDKYAQEKVRAVFRNGILKVTIPPKEEPDQSDGIKIEIIREGD